jgi:hypothetical protein
MHFLCSKASAGGRSGAGAASVAGFSDVDMFKQPTKDLELLIEAPQLDRTAASKRADLFQLYIYYYLKIVML